MFKRIWSTILMKGGRWWQDPKADAFWGVGTKSYLFQPSNTAENDLVGRQYRVQGNVEMTSKLKRCRNLSPGVLKEAGKRAGKPSGSFKGTAGGADIIRATDLGRGVGLGRSTDGTDVSWMVDWECVWGVGQTTSRANRVPH